MATTTPNYGWDVPTSTDYVKDGATAIETLGDDIDSSLFSITGGKNVGLVHLNTTNFSGSVSVAVANVFSSNYTNYRILLNPVVDTTRQIIYLQMTGASTNYFFGVAGWRSNGTAYNANSANTLPGFITTFADTDSRNFASIDVGAPNLTQFTTFVSTFNGGDSSSPLNGSAGGFLLNSTQHTGFTLAASNNISGSVSVYGYRK